MLAVSVLRNEIISQKKYVIARAHARAAHPASPVTPSREAGTTLRDPSNVCQTKQL